jgi:hypothetical protein
MVRRRFQRSSSAPAGSWRRRTGAICRAATAATSAGACVSWRTMSGTTTLRTASPTFETTCVTRKIENGRLRRSSVSTGDARRH